MTFVFLKDEGCGIMTAKRSLYLRIPVSAFAAEIRAQPLPEAARTDKGDKRNGTDQRSLQRLHRKGKKHRRTGERKQRCRAEDRLCRF
ncbi:hypothetical protein DW757_07955 [Clostridium sp. AM29-11AC]|nr:hypothetical protein DW757_07955 [Clostridium sp. AM29-11AC]